MVYTAVNVKRSVDLSHIIGFFVHRIIRHVIIVNICDWLTF